MSKKRWMMILMLMAFVLAACGRAAFEEPAPMIPVPAEGRGAAATPAMAAEPPMEAMAEGAFAGESDSTTITRANVLQTEVQERLIIRTGDLSVVVEDTEESLAAISGMATGRGGWVVGSNVYEFSGAKQGTITIRVPAEQFDAVIAQIKAMAVEVTGETTSGQDVTEEYVDLSARLANLEATADRVRNFLDQAKDVEDALAVNAELSRLESEIEAMKGRIQYLTQSAAFSTITVSLTPDELAQPIEIGGWRPEGVAREAIEALVNTLQNLAEAGIWLVIYVLPVALLILVPLWLVARFALRAVQRRRQRPGAQS